MSKSRRIIAIFIVVAAVRCTAHWGDITRKGCVSTGAREWSAILWDAGAEEWDQLCRRLPGEVAGEYRPPDRCVTGLNEWGVWYVPEAQCWQPQPGDEPLRFDVSVFDTAGVPLNVVYELVKQEVLVGVSSGVSGDPYIWSVDQPYHGGAWRVRAHARVRRASGELLDAGTADVNLRVPFEPRVNRQFVEFRLRSGASTASGYRIEGVPQN
jgi:hypothetical protein